MASVARRARQCLAPGRVWSAAQPDGVTFLTHPRRVPQHVDASVIDDVLKEKCRSPGTKNYLFLHALTLRNAFGLRLCEPAIGS